MCIVDAEGKLVGYDYAFGSPYAGGDVYTMVYDDQGLVTEMQSYGRGCKVFVRDGLGRVTEIWGYTPNDSDRHRLRCQITYDEQARTMIVWTDDGEIEENALPDMLSTYMSMMHPEGWKAFMDVLRTLIQKMRWKRPLLSSINVINDTGPNCWSCADGKRPILLNSNKGLCKQGQPKGHFT